LEASLDEFVHLTSIQEYVAQLLDEYPKAVFFAPLGAGNHFDHVELFLSSITMATEQKALERFFFYEEGYAMGTRMRRKHPVTQKICWNNRQAPASRSITWFVISNVMAAQRRGRPVLEYLPAEYSDLHWTVRRQSIEPFEGRKIQAMARYESQIQAFGGIGMFARILRQYHRFWGNAEPYWTASVPV
jgi:hypothetical protein